MTEDRHRLRKIASLSSAEEALAFRDQLNEQGARLTDDESRALFVRIAELRGQR